MRLDVERLTFGFDALAHDAGQVVFVPYAAPGDTVEAEPVERRRDWIRARVERVLAPGPARVLPGCPAFPTCGGCQWQHVSPAAQREAKRDVVAGRRVGHEDDLSGVVRERVEAKGQPLDVEPHANPATDFRHLCKGAAGW